MRALIRSTPLLTIVLLISTAHADWCERSGLNCIQDSATTSIQGTQTELIDARARIGTYLDEVCSRTREYSVLCNRSAILHSRLSRVMFFGRNAARGARFPASGLRVVTDCSGTSLQVSLLKLQTPRDLTRFRTAIESIARGELGSLETRFAIAMSQAHQIRVRRGTPHVFAMTVIYNARMNGHFDRPLEAIFGNSSGLISLDGDIDVPSRVLADSCIAAAQIPRAGNAVAAAPIAPMLPQFPGDPALPNSVHSDNPAVQACLVDSHRMYYSRLRWHGDCTEVRLDPQSQEADFEEVCESDPEIAQIVQRHFPVMRECLETLRDSAAMPEDIRMQMDVATQGMEPGRGSTRSADGTSHATYQTRAQCQRLRVRHEATKRWCLADPCVCAHMQTQATIFNNEGYFDSTNCGDSVAVSDGSAPPSAFERAWANALRTRGLAYWRQCFAQLR